MSPGIASAAKPDRILVTGGAGYLGSVVVRQLLRRGFRVRVLDSFPFGDASLDELKSHPRLRLIRGDVRRRGAIARAVDGCAAVVHLAAIVGDPACDADPDLAIDVNLTATRALVEAAQAVRVRRFVFASSCSVYGASDSLLDETSPLNPLSVYARTKIDCEKLLLAAATGTFSPVVLRFGTLFGLSPQMRFDLVVNLFVGRAAATGRITIFNEQQWRPFLHVEDAARATVACVEAAPAPVSGEIFNAGSPALNLQIRDVGDAVQRLIPDTMIERIENYADLRNYRVSFAKIQRALAFDAARSLDSGISEIYASIRADMLENMAIRPSNVRAFGRFIPLVPHEQRRPIRRAASAD